MFNLVLFHQDEERRGRRWNKKKINDVLPSPRYRPREIVMSEEIIYYSVYIKPIYINYTPTHHFEMVWFRFLYQFHFSPTLSFPWSAFLPTLFLSPSCMWFIFHNSNFKSLSTQLFSSSNSKPMTWPRFHCVPMRYFKLEIIAMIECMNSLTTPARADSVVTEYV